MENIVNASIYLNGALKKYHIIISSYPTGIATSQKRINFIPPPPHLIRYLKQSLFTSRIFLPFI